MIKTVFHAALFVLAAAAAQAAPSFTMSFVVPCKDGDKPRTIVGDVENLCLSPDHIIDAADITRVQRVPTVNIVTIEITEAASERLWDASYDKAGERVGVLFDERLIAAPAIVAPVHTRTLTLILNNDPADVDALADAFPGKSS
ncbi:MAG: hypothetical protein KGJ78_05215 [Alphaproteobacteria bacterium]|nr:hypothetical protein [Alphaproteobacteria bacterium]